MNHIVLRGIVAKPVEWSHTSHDERFSRLWLDVCRLSGKNDRLRVLLPQSAGFEPPEGTTIELSGQMRTYNNKSGVGGRLIISALAREIMPSEGAHMNRILVSGTLCRAPGYRKTPLGREICDLMLAVPRTYSRTDYLPLIAWGGTARACAMMETGSPLFAEGRFQSRGYTKIIDGEPVDMTAYEISVVRLASCEAELTEQQ